MLVVVLAGIAGLFILANKQLAILKNPFLWIGMLLGNFPAIAWYFAQWQHYGDIFLEVHFQSQAFDRLGKAVEGNTGPVWYYLLEVIKYGFPWLLFLPGGLYLSWKNRDTAWGCLTLIGTIVYFAIVSLMGTKLPWYIMPVYPFLALAIGANLSYIWQGGKFRSKFLTGFFGFLIIVGLAGCVYFSIVDKQPLLIVMSIILAITMVITSWLINQHNRQFISVLLTGMYLVLALLMSSQSWIWELNEKFPVVPVATLIKDNVPPGTQIYTSFPDSRPSLDFYSDCKIIPASIADLQDKFVHKSYLLVDNETLQKMNLKQSKIIGEAKGFNLIVMN
jgi:4-amino-4-deoxy-L-arabinose transferase-like glycosyltransferase